MNKVLHPSGAEVAEESPRGDVWTYSSPHVEVIPLSAPLNILESLSTPTEFDEIQEGGQINGNSPGLDYR